MTNVAATEIAAGDGAFAQEPQATEPAASSILNASVSDESANAVAESHWDSGNNEPLSQEWVDVKVPRDPAETETGLTATPAAPANTQSWADDQPEPASEVGLLSVHFLDVRNDPVLTKPLAGGAYCGGPQ